MVKDQKRGVKTSRVYILAFSKRALMKKMVGYSGVGQGGVEIQGRPNPAGIGMIVGTALELLSTVKTGRKF